MYQHFFRLPLIVATLCATGLTLTARADTPARPSGLIRGDNPDIGIKYDAKQGLYVTPFSAKLLNLSMADVEEHALSSTLTLQAQVFEISGDGALASAWISQKDAEKITAGTRVDFDRSFVGTILRITAELNRQAEAIIEITTPGAGLKAGKFLEGTIALHSDGAVVVVPRRSVIKSADGVFAYVDNGGWTLRTEIELGAADGELVEVTDGLYVGDVIVTAPVMTLWMTELQLLKSGKA